MVGVLALTLSLSMYGRASDTEIHNVKSVCEALCATHVQQELCLQASMAEFRCDVPRAPVLRCNYDWMPVSQRCECFGLRVGVQIQVKVMPQCQDVRLFPAVLGPKWSPSVKMSKWGPSVKMCELLNMPGSTAPSPQRAGIFVFWDQVFEIRVRCEGLEFCPLPFFGLLVCGSNTSACPHA